MQSLQPSVIATLCNTRYHIWTPQTTPDTRTLTPRTPTTPRNQLLRNQTIARTQQPTTSPPLPHSHPNVDGLLLGTLVFSDNITARNVSVLGPYSTIMYAYMYAIVHHRHTWNYSITSSPCLHILQLCMHTCMLLSIIGTLGTTSSHHHPASTRATC